MQVSGSVTMVASAADETTRLVPVLAQIENSDGRLRAHQVGNVTVVLGAPQPTVIVPTAAVQYDGQIAYLFIQRKPTIFRGLAVHVLATTAAGIAVDRVIPGDVVAITGTDVLKGNLFQDKFGPGCCAK
jgi:multidrug efflux pump subunit AcrA (membrane-fusion protein)